MGEWTGRGGSRGEDELRRDLDDEIEAHVAMRTDELVAAGMSPSEARAEAERRFGDREAARRGLTATARRSRRRLRMRAAWDATLADVRLAARRARRSPGFTAIALLVFAGGVGLTTSMFTLADHVLLRPLPHPEPDRLVALWSRGEKGNEFSLVSMGNWVDWREGASTLRNTALYAELPLSIGTEDDAFHVPGARVIGPFFATLANPPLVGRFFTEEEAQAGAPVIVVGEGFWRRVLDAAPMDTRPEVVVDGMRRQVTGVVREGEGFPGGVDVWVPFAWRPEGGGQRNNINYLSVARLRDGATADQTRAELATVAAGIRERDPEALYSWGVGVRPLRQVVVGEARSWLGLLAAAVGFLLLVACANLAGLSLARANRRTQETAVHLALGAGRGRLVRRAMIEHVLLGLAGGAIGVVAAWLGSTYLMREVAGVLPRVEEVGFDGRVAAFGLVAAAVAGLLAGMLPAVLGSRGSLASVLSGARGGVAGGRGLPGAVLVGAEVALAVALLIAGGLLLRSFQAVMAKDLGFDPVRVVTAEVSLVGPAYRDPDVPPAYWSRLLERVAALPGVETAAAASAIPTSDGARGFIDIPGNEGSPTLGAGYVVVTDRYFDALDVPLTSGRGFAATDVLGTERVTVISRLLADELWPGQDPLGRRIRARSMEAWLTGGQAPWITVVGVVPDLRQYGHEYDPAPDMYVLYRQVPYYARNMTLVAETRPGAGGIEQTVKAAVRELDPGVAVEIGSLPARLSALTEERRLVLYGLGLFGGAALVLVCLGIYGLVSFAVEERTRELAVRAALGADRGGILSLVLASALRVVAAGALIGVAGALGLARPLGSLLVEVSTSDPMTYLGSAVLIVLVGLTAALVPSLRAARMDPLEALRRG